METSCAKIRLQIDPVKTTHISINQLGNTGIFAMGGDVLEKVEGYR